MSAAKITVAKKAIGHIEKKLDRNMVLGIGTGSTVNFFIEELAKFKNLFKGAVSSSEASTKLLQDIGIEVFNLNDVNEVSYYIDGADEVSPENFLIKGGGGAHTREKIVAAASKSFICIVDSSKLVDQLGLFPLPIEVIPESRSMVARKIIELGGLPEYRSGFINYLTINFKISFLFSPSYWFLINFINTKSCVNVSIKYICVKNFFYYSFILL